MKDASKDRAAALEFLAGVWPKAKLGKESNDNLIWLMEVATVLAEEHGPRTMSATLLKYRERYQPTVAYSGRPSLNNGDAVAEFLAGKAPDEVLKAAEQILGLESGELQERYAKLNPGQQRMNGGNRIRAALKRGDITTDELH